VGILKNLLEYKMKTKMNHISHVQKNSTVNVMVFEVFNSGTIIVNAEHTWAFLGEGLKRRSSAIHLNASSIKFQVIL
jgi:hypothetical protein